MKRILKLLSIVMSLVILTAAAVVPIWSEEADYEPKTYQHVKKLATLSLDESVFAYSEELFAIDNVIYDGNGKKVNEIPLFDDNGALNIVAYLDGRYAYTMYTDFREEGWFNSQLLDADTGKVIAGWDKEFSTDWAHGFYSIGGDIYIDGVLEKSFDCAAVMSLGGDMYLTLTEEDLGGELPDENAVRYLYDHRSGETHEVSDTSVFPGAYFDGCENGWAYVKDAEGNYVYSFMIDRTGNPVTSCTYSNVIMYDDAKGIYSAYSIEEPGKLHLLDNDGNILFMWDSTEEEGQFPIVITDKYIVTEDENELYRVYDRNGYTTDGNVYSWFRKLDDNSFTVGDGDYGSAPDLIYNADGSVTETALNCVFPMVGGKYLVGYDDEADTVTVCDREFNFVCNISDDYTNVYRLECDDLLLAERDDGKYGFVSYEDEVLIPFIYDNTMSVDMMQRFSNGNVFIALGYSVDDSYYYDLYLLIYNPTHYWDVKQGAWYVDAVKYVYETGLMNGMSDNTFAPNEQMTRAQLVTVLWRMAGSPEAEYTDRFSDVKEKGWYASAVMWAAENGIVDGFPDGTFAPNQPITRDQLAAVLFRYTEFAGGDTSARGDISNFTDGDKVQTWALNAVEWAVGEGIISGKPVAGKVSIAPKAYATRAEVATMLMRYLSE